MALDPMTLIMFGLIAVLIVFMIRNGRKRQQAAQEMQSKLRPGAEVMLQSGIYGTVEEVDEAENRVTVRSGTSTLVVHRNAVGQIIAPADSPEAPADEVAPDDDPAFGERVGGNDSPVDGEAQPGQAEAQSGEAKPKPESEEGDKA